MPALQSVVDTSIKVPRAFIKVSLGVGPRSAGSAPMKVCIFGNKTTAGTAAVNTPVAVYSKDDAKALFGPGSELHLMARAAFKANPSVTLWATPITAAGTAATAAAVFSGTAMGAGTVECWIMGERVVIDVVQGDTATVIGTNLAAAINKQTDWPVTATNSTGTVTITAKNTGPRGNSITVRTRLTAAPSVTHSALASKLSSGATTDDPQAALDAVASQRYHLLVSPHSTTPEVQKFRAHAQNNANPIPGRRQRFVYAINDTLANSVTISDAVNSQRGEFAWIKGADDTPAMIAAAYAATLAMFRSADRAAPLNGVPLIGIKPPFALTDIPTEAELNAALNSGISPLKTVDGVVCFTRSVTNYHLDSSGNPDASVLDSHKVDVADFIGDTLEINFSTAFAGFKLGVDDEDGSPPAAKVATPKTVRDWAAGILQAQDGKLIVNVAANMPALVAEADMSADGRINLEVPIDVIEHFHQLGVNVAQIG